MYGAFEGFDRRDIFADLAPSNSTSHSHIRNQFVVGGVIRQVIIGTRTEFCKYILLHSMGRAIWGNIQLEGGSIGPSVARDNTATLELNISPYCPTHGVQ